MTKEKEIPFKNYIILAVILLISILLIIYSYMWYSNYQDKKLNTPIMDKYLQVINYNELDDYLIENKSAIIYTSVLENEEIRNFEIKFKNTIISNSLNSSMLYLDLTEVLNNKNKYRTFINTYTIDGQDITNVPSILKFQDGKLVSIYDIKKVNYSTEKIETYLTKEGLIE